MVAGVAARQPKAGGFHAFCKKWESETLIVRKLTKVIPTIDLTKLLIEKRYQQEF